MAAYDLEATQNVMEIKCKLSDQTFEMGYRMPTTSERVAYENAVTQRKGGKIQIAKDWQIVQAKMGARLCTSIRKGDWAVGGKIISSDKSDPDFYPEWRNKVFKVRPDVFAHMAATIFTALGKQGDEPDTADDDDRSIEDLLDPNAFSFDDNLGDAPDLVAASAPAEAGQTENP
jgi:hypothetical protein